MQKSQKIKEAVGIALTASRYGLAENMARRIKSEKPIILAMAALITADVLDGVVLRKFDCDTSARRVADGVIDHASVARVASEVAVKHPDTIPYIGVLATRAAVVGVLNLYHLAKTGEVTKGQDKQRATNLATALFAIAAASGNKKLTHVAGVFASGVAISTIPHYFKKLGQAHPDHPQGIREL